MRESQEATWIQLDGAMPSRPARMFCARCGESAPIPAEARAAIKSFRDFEAVHSCCLPDAAYRHEVILRSHSEPTTDGRALQLAASLNTPSAS